MKGPMFLIFFVAAASLSLFGQGPETPASTPLIKVETREVLVDTIVTDKKGEYVKDLAAKDFRVWEDDKEQTIRSFTYAADSASPASRNKHYLVLFFDTASMDIGDQGRARIAAGQFVDANGGANQYIAVANFGGTLQIAQNFTQDAARLKRDVTTMKFSAVSPGDDSQIASLGAPVSLSSGGEFAVRSVLLALRSLAKDLQPIPGRKSVVLLSSGFQVTPELESEVAAAIDACNKANVAVYPIDVRGLATGMSPQVRLIKPGPGTQPSFAAVSRPTLTAASLRWVGTQMAANGGARLLSVAQRSGGQTGGGAPRAGGGRPTAPRAGAGNVRPRPAPADVPRMAPGMPRPLQPRPIVPPLISSVTANQQVLRQLADGTGGFVIVNSNDLLGGMQKVSNEQSQYYILGYEPSDPHDASCHTIRVKIDRSNTVVRARSGYCSVKPRDLLAGKPIEKELENRANGAEAGVAASMIPSFFYTSANTARVNLAIDMPAGAIKFEKEKGKFKAAVDVLGIAYKPDGSVGARFSDTATLEFDEKSELEEFRKGPYHYENQFDIGCGTYTLKVAFSSGGESFGKLEAPLPIDPYDGKHFNMSGLVLSGKMVRVSDINAGVESELIEDRKPFIYDGLELVPAGAYRFKKTDKLGAYLEVYDPLLLGENPPKLSLKIVVLDVKTAKPAVMAVMTDTSKAIKPGSPVVPLALRIPVEKLDVGTYRLELQAVDAAGNMTKIRTADFELE